jgi:hypothetical protein
VIKGDNLLCKLSEVHEGKRCLKDIKKSRPITQKPVRFLKTSQVFYQKSPPFLKGRAFFKVY